MAVLTLRAFDLTDLSAAPPHHGMHRQFAGIGPKTLLTAVVFILKIYRKACALVWSYQ
jgi:hypothetical protein